MPPVPKQLPFDWQKESEPAFDWSTEAEGAPEPDFSGVQGGASSAPLPNTYQIEQSGAGGGVLGWLAGLPKGAEAIAKIQSLAGNRQVSPEEVRAFLEQQKTINPTSFGRGEIGGKATPAILAAMASGGLSLPAQAGIQGVEGYAESRVRGAEPQQALRQGLVQGGLTAAGGLAAKGLGMGLEKAADVVAPYMKRIADAAILKQSGFGTGMGSLFKKKGTEGLEQMAQDLGPEIRPTVQWTARHLGNIVDEAETVRGQAVQALDKAFVKEPGMPTLMDVVDNAKAGLAKAVQKNPSLLEHAKTIGSKLDTYVEQWGPESKSFAQFDDMRRQIAELGKFDRAAPEDLQQLYRATSGVIRKNIDSTAFGLASGNEAKALLASKGVLNKFIEPAEKAAQRSAEMGSHSVIGIPGSVGMGVGLHELMAGRPLAAAGSIGMSLLQKPGRQAANYALAKGAGGLANYLGAEAPGVGGFLTSGPGELTSGVAASMMSKRLFPAQVGELAERLGAKEAPIIKSAANQDDTTAKTIHQYMMANNDDYSRVMNTAGTSQDRRQP